MPPIGSALAGRIRRCGAWLTGPDFCLSRCVGGTGIWETAPPAALGGKFGTYGDLISLPLWSADGRAFVLYHVILPLPQAIWMQEYRKAGCHGLRDACSYPLSGGRSASLLPPGFIKFLRHNDAAAVPGGPSPK